MARMGCRHSLSLQQQHMRSSAAAFGQKMKVEQRTESREDEVVQIENTRFFLLIIILIEKTRLLLGKKKAKGLSPLLFVTFRRDMGKEEWSAGMADFGLAFGRIPALIPWNVPLASLCGALRLLLCFQIRCS